MCGGKGGKGGASSDAGSEKTIASGTTVKSGYTLMEESNYCCPKSRYSPRYWARRLLLEP